MYFLNCDLDMFKWLNHWPLKLAELRSNLQEGLILSFWHFLAAFWAPKMPDEHLRMDLADLLSQEGELLDISCFLLLKMHGTVETTLSVPVERNAQIFIKRINRRQVHNNYFQHCFSLNQFNVQCTSIYTFFSMQVSSLF